MSKTTPRLGFSYPSENQNPWYEDFESAMLFMDSSLAALFENGHSIVVGDAALVWDGTSLIVGAGLRLLSCVNGVYGDILPATYEVREGEYLYVEASSGATEVVELSPVTGSSLPSDMNLFVLAYAYGGRLYWCNGKVMDAGDSLEGVASKARARAKSISSNVTLGVERFQLVDSSAGSLILTLPDPSGLDGVQITIKDAVGSAGIYSFTVEGGGAFIDNANSVVISVAFGYLELYCTGTSWLVVGR